MKITIDTSQDSKEDIRKVVALLSNFLSSSESSVMNNSSGSVFPDSVSEAGFFGAENNESISLGNNSGTNTGTTVNNSSSLSNNNNLSENNAAPQLTQEQSMPFMNIFGDDSSANTSAGNSNSGNNVLSNNSSINNNNTINNNLGNVTNVSNQPTAAPDIFSVFGSANNSSQNNLGSSNQINNIGTNYTGNNLNNNEPAKPKKTFAGIFKGIPILGNLSFGQDEQHDELTEQEKEAAKKIVEY